MKKKIFAGIIFAMLLTGCSNSNNFDVFEDVVYLPAPTEMSFKSNGDNTKTLSEEKSLEFYNTYLKSLKFERFKNSFIGGIEIEYSYHFDQYPNGDKPIQLFLANFNMISFRLVRDNITHEFLCNEEVPYIEMHEFLIENSN